MVVSTFLNGCNEKHDWIPAPLSEIESINPDGFAYILLVAPGQMSKNVPFQIQLKANITRESIISLANEFLRTCCGEDQWLKHNP